MKTFIITFIEDLRDRWVDKFRRIKVAKIRRVFEREGGLIPGTLSSRHSSDTVCDHPGRCATGALLFAAGVVDYELQQSGRPSDRPEWVDLLEKVYGLSDREWGALLRANDSSLVRDIWAQCGVHTRPVQIVRICVVNDSVRKLASA